MKPCINFTKLGNRGISNPCFQGCSNHQVSNSDSSQWALAAALKSTCLKILINTTTLSIFNGKLFEIIPDFNALPSALQSAVMTNNNHICWMFADANYLQSVHSSLILIQKCHNYLCLPNRIYTFVTCKVPDTTNISFAYITWNVGTFSTPKCCKETLN